MADFFDDVFDFDSPGRRARKRPIVEALKEEEGPGVIASLGSNALSLLSAVGNTLDTPASQVRAFLGGDQIGTGLTRPAERTSGRDILERQGILNKNVEGFHPIDNPMDALGDIAGFATEVATDPLTYLTLGGSALTKAGKAVKAAGMFDDVAEVASRKLGREVGKREARIASTAADMFGGDARAAAARLGISEREALDPLGGMANFMGMTLGTGGAGRAAARGMDAVGHAARFGDIPIIGYSPGRHFAQAFDYRVGGNSTTLGQKAAMKATRTYERGMNATNVDAQRVADVFHRNGLGDEAGGWRVRAMLEGVEAPPNAEVAEAVQFMRQRFEEGFQSKYNAGLNPHRLDDPAGVNYAARHATDVGQPQTGQSGFFSVNSPDDLARAPEFKGIRGGTRQLGDIARDPEVVRMSGDLNTPLRDLDAYIRTTYGHAIMDHNQIPAMAQRFRNTPTALLERGIFDNHPVVDFITNQYGVKRAVSNVEPVLDVVRRTAVPQNGPYDAAHFTPANHVLGELGFDVRNFSNYNSHLIPRAEADDLRRMFQGFKTPDSVGHGLQMVDSFMNLWKAGVLTRPARYVRDLISGGVRNQEEGVLSMRGITGFHNLITGGEVKGAEKIPFVAEQLRLRRLGPEHATNVLRQVVGAYGMAGNKQAAGSVVGNLAVATPTGHLDDVLSAQPGHHPVSIGEGLRTVSGKTAGARWNPLSVRGVAGQTETNFPIVKGGEYLGHYTDSANRVPGFLELLYQGVDPDEAARRINAAQVDYSGRTFTEFERKVMKRVAPFYSFIRKQAPYTAETLMEKPGGRMAQEIRLANQANKDPEPLPDKVTSSMAIPLGKQEDGTKRFLTSLGLMHEDPLSLVQIGDSALDTASKTGRQLIGRVNPIIKAGAEIPFGKLAFSGQDLQDADPSIGRMVTNIKDTITGERTETAYGAGDDTGSAAEYIAQGIPGLSSVTNILRTGFDPRKSIGDKALNIGTGVKVTDISPRTQEAVIIERVKDQLKRSGGKILERPYIPEGTRANAEPGQLDRADELLGLLKLQDKQRAERQGKGGKKPRQRKNDNLIQLDFPF